MSSASNSPSKKSLDDVDGLSISSLPEDVLVHISSKVAASSDSTDNSSLAKVSRKFRRISNEPYVLRSFSKEKILKLRWSPRSEQRRIKLQRTLESGNPEAMFHEGCDQIFRNGQHDLGMNILLQAANLGSLRSIYLAGVFLICLGGENKQRGCALLSSLLEKRVADCTEKLKKIKEDVARNFWSHEEVMRGFKESYTRDDCRCDGKTKEFFSFLRWPTSDWDLLTADACKTCIWDHEVEQFFNWI